MKKVIYSPDYREKLLQLRNELDQKYGDVTRKRILEEINHRIQQLKTFHYLGISLREKYGIDCEYRYLYVAHHIIFYIILESSINIIDMYSEREEYIIKFFGKVNLHEET